MSGTDNAAHGKRSVNPLRYGKLIQPPEVLEKLSDETVAIVKTR
jgi:hypothetical protein